MFTGIIKDLGRVRRIERLEDGSHRLVLGTDLAVDEFEEGESIAIDGACLTVVEAGDGVFSVDVSPETRDKTTLGDLKDGDDVHLERALRVGDRLGGHFVTGHVDDVGRVVANERREDCWELAFEAPASVARYLLPKGSITVDGVSLTINDVAGDRFEVTVIPHTAEVTKLAGYTTDTRVNLEADLLGKYVDRLHGDEGTGGVDINEHLSEAGKATGSRHDSE